MMVVVVSVAIGQLLCGLGIVEHLQSKELIAKPAVETFDISILPRASWLDVKRADVELIEPSPKRATETNSGPLSLRMYIGSRAQPKGLPIVESLLHL